MQIALPTPILSLIPKLRRCLARITRPQPYWLGLISSPGEQKFLEEKNFGTFWQIARTKDPIALNFSHREIEDILARLRQLNLEKGDYGGPGWANYATSYFNDCDESLKKDLNLAFIA